MPSVAKSSKWFIRITSPWDHIRSKVSTIQGWIDYESMMIGYHHGDKRGAPHAHFCLVMKTELQKQSIDVRMKNYLMSVVLNTVLNCGMVTRRLWLICIMTPKAKS